MLDRHRATIWKGVGVGGFLLLCVAGVTAFYFGTVHEEILFGSGRLLDCGSALSPNDSAVAQANCDGTTSGDLLGLVLMLLVAVAAIAMMVLATSRERSRRR